MNRGDIISYTDMTTEEGISLQRGMNYSIANKNYAIILMSVRENSPYADKFEDSNTTIIYEGHDVQLNYISKEINPKEIDQPLTTPKGSLTENGKFFEAAHNYKNGQQTKSIKVYEKIKSGIWVYNGFFKLTDAWKQKETKRNVFKFKLEMIQEEIKSDNCQVSNILELEHNRLIPTSVKIAVWNRDKGKCVKCGSSINLHYDHIIPFSKGGSSTTPDNIQLLCSKCNLAKHNKIE